MNELGGLPYLSNAPISRASQSEKQRRCCLVTFFTTRVCTLAQRQPNNNIKM